MLNSTTCGIQLILIIVAAEAAAQLFIKQLKDDCCCSDNCRHINYRAAEMQLKIDY